MSTRLGPLRPIHHDLAAFCEARAKAQEAAAQATRSSGLRSIALDFNPNLPPDASLRPVTVDGQSYIELVEVSS